jgi:hypothetical protein
MIVGTRSAVRDVVFGEWFELRKCCLVQSHAAAAVINFTENCNKEIIKPYVLHTLVRAALSQL